MRVSNSMLYIIQRFSTPLLLLFWNIKYVRHITITLHCSLDVNKMLPILPSKATHTGCSSKVLLTLASMQQCSAWCLFSTKQQIFEMLRLWRDTEGGTKEQIKGTLHKALVKVCRNDIADKLMQEQVDGSQEGVAYSSIIWGTAVNPSARHYPSSLVFCGCTSTNTSHCCSQSFTVDHCVLSSGDVPSSLRFFCCQGCTWSFVFEVAAQHT